MPLRQFICLVIASFPVIAGAAVITPAAASQDDSIGTARAYLTAYERQDLAAMRTFMAEDMVFTDPTSFDLVHVGEPIHWTGPEAILNGISAWGLTHARYSIDRIYSAAGHVIIDAEIDVTYPGSGQTRTFRYPIITILTVQDGLVREHRDYTGFNDMYELAREAME